MAGGTPAARRQGGRTELRVGGDTTEAGWSLSWRGQAPELPTATAVESTGFRREMLLLSVR